MCVCKAHSVYLALKSMIGWVTCQCPVLYLALCVCERASEKERSVTKGMRTFCF